jgi:thiamine-monophosphate kinase
MTYLSVSPPSLGRRKIPSGEVHVGDDAAVLAPFVGEALISTDVAVLGVHLDETLFPLEDLGFKAVAAAVSDLAAMGGRPRAAVVAVSSPPGTDLEELHRGIADAATITNCPIVGATSRSPGRLGCGDRDGGVSRSRRGAAQRREGRRRNSCDRTARKVGRGAAPTSRRCAPLNDELVVAHRRPWPRIEEGIAARNAGAHAMMDLSDGLGIDLHRLADASRVGFELTHVPVAQGATLEEAIERRRGLRVADRHERFGPVAHDLHRPRASRADHHRHHQCDVNVRCCDGEPFERRGWQHQL